MNERRCALYRHFDEFGLLLYIGITESPAVRGDSHARNSDWVKYADRIEARWYDSREDAAKAEKDAILREGPVFNVAGADVPFEDRLNEYLDQRAELSEKAAHLLMRCAGDLLEQMPRWVVFEAEDRAMREFANGGYVGHPPTISLRAVTLKALALMMAAGEVKIHVPEVDWSPF